MCSRSIFFVRKQDRRKSNGKIHANKTGATPEKNALLNFQGSKNPVPGHDPEPPENGTEKRELF